MDEHIAGCVSLPRHQLPVVAVSTVFIKYKYTVGDKYTVCVPMWIRCACICSVCAYAQSCCKLTVDQRSMVELF